ncbi:MAG: glycoside hydrolase family 9 protein [Dysgonamonadaceae bacterium]|jgi:hypothetical protein|nr:glycoside hydrolase family 9 protein [Dysgonamonadaceae bacterium]
MKLLKNRLLFLIAGLTSLPLCAQIRLTQDTVLEKAIIQSGLIHSPLPLDNARSFETRGLAKKLISRRPFDLSEKLVGWTHSGWGQLSFSTEKTISGAGSLKMEFPTSTRQRAVGSPDDRDYATYGSCRIQKDAGGENWESFNRIVFAIYPDCEGARVVNLNFTFENAGTPASPDTHRRSASHLIHLKNRQWNHCFLDLDEFQRDKVLQIGFSCSVKGKDRTTGDQSVFYIDSMELQQIEDPEIVSGWLPGKNKIIYSTTGYELHSPKTAIVNPDGAPLRSSFQLLDASKNVAVYTATIRQEKTTTGSFGILDFTTFDHPGDYRLKWGGTLTPPFHIGARIWENSMWRVLNFIFCQRCGYPVPEKHGTCHIDLWSEHNGQKISYAGGWHDAGDLSQQTLQTGDVTYALLELYKNQKDKNNLLARRLLEEAGWGLEFILRNRYGDGYRASSMGLLIWQDGIFGTVDDISSVRVQNLAFDNFLYAAYEAYAAMTVDNDPMLQEYLAKIAREDFEFALEKHKASGFGGFLYPYEHSYNTSESQYQATLSWAASRLYQLTQDPYFAALAAESIRYTLDCQQKEPLNDKNGTKGFFYRNLSRQSIVHYVHQSREQIYMQALTLLCETQPQHPDYRQWVESIRLYGDYLKNLMPYTAPYGMLPSGVYHIDEYKDTESFNHLHLFPPDNAAELYVRQVKKGVPLDGEHYLMRFPVGFGIFNGNLAVHLSMGKAAAVCGNFLKDEELLRIGKEQMAWTAGKNPFGQSLIYGEGWNYSQMDSFSSGEITGGMPVGVRSLDNEDVPYWPQVNNACYKEVWVTSAGKWLSLLSEY